MSAEPDESYVPVPPHIKDRDVFERGRVAAREGKRATLADLYRLAELTADQATGTREWDRFLEILQGQLNEAESMLTKARELLCAPELVDHAEMLKAKIDVARLTERADTLRQVIGLPNQLRKQAGDAAEE